jgi:hypothetical protein
MYIQIHTQHAHMHPQRDSCCQIHLGNQSAFHLVCVLYFLCPSIYCVLLCPIQHSIISIVLLFVLMTLLSLSQSHHCQSLSNFKLQTKHIKLQKRKLPVWLCTGFSLGYLTPAISIVQSMVVQSARIACFRGNSILFPSSGGSKFSNII